MITDSIYSTVQAYIDGVACGDIATSTLVRKAVLRHVSDLSKQSTSDFPYHFDQKLASKVCRFYPTFLRHSIGKHAGMPFHLEPWQAFCEWVIFGWRRDSDNSRRFRRAYESMARKNGKSTRIAGRSIFMGMADQNPITMTQEQVAQIILCATKKEQAEKVIYEEVQRMRLSSPAIKSRSLNVKNSVRFTANDGTIQCVGSDKPFDGLNPHAVMMDELHAWRDHHREFYDTMVTGSGSRLQPLISMVTTAGNDKSYLWKEIYDYAKGICFGTVKDESFFAFIAELDPDDDPLDERNWIKANPNLGVSVDVEYLREQAMEARSSAQALNRFTRYHGNRIVSSSESAFDLGEWDECAQPLSDWSKAEAVFAGADLGSRDDLAAYGLCAKFPIGETDGNPVYRYEIKVRAFLADDSSRDSTKHPFCDWIHDGQIVKSKFAIAEMRDRLVEDCNTYGITHVAYDPYNGQQLCDDLTREGIKAVRMPQNCAMFNEPIRDLLQTVKDKRLAHGGKSLLRWCAKNAIIKADGRDQWMFDKGACSDKIDPIVAATMAFRLAVVMQTYAKVGQFIV